MGCGASTATAALCARSTASRVVGVGPACDDRRVESEEELIRRLVAGVPGLGPVAAVDDAGAGRGVFSTVARLHFADGSTLVAKLPGPNRGAAITSGAFERERWTYQLLAPDLPIRAPRCHALVDLDDGAAAFLLDDLGSLRWVDQADGLATDDIARIAAALAPMHQWGRSRLDAHPLDRVRRHAPTTFPAEALAAGLAAAERSWGGEVDLAPLAHRLERRADDLAAFSAAPATICHGDARADNLAFDGDDVVLFDFQQIAVQTPGADLAWLVATSCVVDDQPAAIDAAVTAHAERTGDSVDATLAALRLGTLHPASAVLLLAGRDTDDPAARAFVGRSLRRIAAFAAQVDAGQ